MIPVAQKAYRPAPGAGWATTIAAFSSTTAGALNFRDHPRLGGIVRLAAPPPISGVGGRVAGDVGLPSPTSVTARRVAWWCLQHTGSCSPR